VPAAPSDCESGSDASAAITLRRNLLLAVAVLALALRLVHLSQIAQAPFASLRLGDAATQRLANSPTNIRAYDKYLEGRKKWNERTRASLEQARELFTEAVKLDPNYAPAYSGLADTYLLLSEAQYGTLTAEEVREYCQGKIAHFKIPQHIRIVDSFPMTVTGKVQKFRIRQMEIERLGLEGQVAATA